MLLGSRSRFLEGWFQLRFKNAVVLLFVGGMLRKVKSCIRFKEVM